MSVQRNFQRHGLPSVENPPQHRGVRGQVGRHILKKGIRHARRFRKGPPGGYRYVEGAYPVELHATKGWRHVTAWT